MNATEFMIGYWACQQGIEHKESDSEAFTRGYNTRYEQEQVEAQMKKVKNEA